MNFLIKNAGIIPPNVDLFSGIRTALLPGYEIWFTWKRPSTTQPNSGRVDWHIRVENHGKHLYWGHGEGERAVTQWVFGIPFPDVFGSETDQELGNLLWNLQCLLSAVTGFETELERKNPPDIDNWEDWGFHGPRIAVMRFSVRKEIQD
jgi:hypothetical protein